MKKKFSFKGLKHSEESKRKISTTRKQLFLNKKIKSGFFKGHKINKNRQFSKETKSLLSKKRKEYIKNGHPIWNKGKHLSKKHKQNLSITHKKRVKAFLKALLKRPTSLELKLKRIILKNRLPFRYVGDGSFIINRMNPDFIHKNKKIAIEIRNTMVCKHLAKLSFTSYKRKRIYMFKKIKWKCLVFSEKDLKLQNKIINKIRKVDSQNRIKN